MNLYGYHATTIKNSKSILKNGFNPVKYAYQHSNPKYKRLYWTWFSHYPQYVYGRMCLKVDLTDLKCVVNESCIICKELYISPDRILEITRSE